MYIIFIQELYMVAEENRDRCKITLKVKQESVLELKKVFFLFLSGSERLQESKLLEKF